MTWLKSNGEKLIPEWEKVKDLETPNCNIYTWWSLIGPFSLPVVMLRLSKSYVISEEKQLHVSQLLRKPTLWRGPATGGGHNPSGQETHLVKKFSQYLSVRYSKIFCPNSLGHKLSSKIPKHMQSTHFMKLGISPSPQETGNINLLRIT